MTTLETIKTTGIVPVFFNSDPDLSRKVLKACYDGGIRAFEFTDRGEGALNVFKGLVAYAREHCPGLKLGAGTMLSANAARKWLDAGAEFLVSPCMVDDVLELALERNVPYTPGCGTVTEIFRAIKAGCELVKVFPAGAVGGPAFVRDVLAPLPDAKLICTGSVEPVEDNVKAWAEAGATALGMGSKLFPRELIEKGDWAAISALCANCLGWFDEARKK